MTRSSFFFSFRLLRAERTKKELLWIRSENGRTKKSYVSTAVYVPLGFIVTTQLLDLVGSVSVKKDGAEQELSQD